MVLKIDWDEIYFDRFEIEDKEGEAKYIFEKALEESGFKFEKVGEYYKTAETADEKDVIYNLKQILKREFFIILREVNIEDGSYIEKDYEEIIDYVKKNYQYDTLTVGEICDSVGISRYEADRYTEEKYDLTVSDYIRNFRVEKAMELLGENVTTEKCARMCGFGSVKTMQRAFKNVCKLSPNGWRSGNLDSTDGK